MDAGKDKPTVWYKMLIELSEKMVFYFFSESRLYSVCTGRDNEEF